MATAFTEIKDGVDAADGDGGGEVWVAEGVYDEQRVSELGSEGFNTGALELTEGISLYGGFNGAETSRAARDWEANATWIDGSTAREGDAAYHVIAGGSNIVIDGFSITGGGAASPLLPAGYAENGAGLYIGGFSLANVTVANCTFVDNGFVTDEGGTGEGGAIYLCMRGTDVCVTDCTFANNRAWYGAVHCGWGVTFTRCAFIGNYGTSRGGAAHVTVVDGYETAFHSCLFAENQVGTGGGCQGGAICSWNDGDIRIENSVFLRNSATGSGGAIMSYKSRHTIVNCTFLDNTAGDSGQALYFYWTDYFKGFEDTSGVIHNSILWGSAGDQLVTFADLSVANPVLVSHSNVHGISARQYTTVDTVNTIDEDPCFLDPGSDDLQLAANSPCIDAGATEEAPAADITGCARPQGAGIDMGAYEYAGGFLIEASSPGPFEEGDELTLSIIGDGILSPTAYAWYKDGIPLAGEDSDVLQFDSLTEAHSGHYWCEVTDDSKGIYSTPHVLVQVYPEGALPASSALGLAMAAVGSALAALRALRTRRRQG